MIIPDNERPAVGYNFERQNKTKRDRIRTSKFR